jgi:hypothetical protein
MALMDAPRGLNEAYAKNSLKSLGVQGGSFKFYNLETQARLPEERALAALGIVLSLILMRLLPWLGGSITVLFLELRGELTSRYLRELIAARLSLLARCAGLTLALALAAGSALTLILRVVSLCLPWQDIPALSGLSREFFDPKLRLLRSCDLSSQVLFYGALILMVLMVVSSVFTRQRTAGLHGPRKDHPGP